jgi:hypothetical protein
VNKEEIAEAVMSGWCNSEFELDIAINEVFNLFKNHNENLLMDFLFYLNAENKINHSKFCFRTEVNKFLYKD